MENYTTNDILSKIKNDPDVDIKIKEKEEKKILISNDSYAIIDHLEKLRLTITNG